KGVIGSVASLAAVAGHHGWTLDPALSGSPDRADLGRVMDLPEWPICQRGPVSPRAAAASVPAWRTLKARKIWEKPRNNARNPTQNKIRYVRWAKAYTRSDPDTQNDNSTNRIPVTRFTHQYGFTARDITPRTISKAP